MKSCLKQTPPVTPTLSTAGTPNLSRSTSPGPDHVHAACSMRKIVSFCGEKEGLEEIFEADDWDRSPAPMTPKLSYQDVLELKQLQLSLPRAHPSPSYRQPFTTSAPRSSYSLPKSPSSPFPISRFATAPSLTPSKWKNRGEPQSFDPEILPYLDAVPIQLLPLLPSQPQAEESGRTSPPHKSMSHAGSTPPSISSSFPPRSPADVPTPKPVSASLPTRTSNFTFLPLLPLQEEEKPSSTAPHIKKPPEPKRKFNMTFIPLLPIEEPQVPASPTPNTEEPSVNLTLGFHPEIQTESHWAPSTDAAVEGDQHNTGTGVTRLLPHFHTSSPSSTPSLSSASDTDTENEAPSTSSPSSPSEHETSDMLASYFASALEASTDTSDINPHFPLIPDGEGASSSTFACSSSSSRPPELHVSSTHHMRLVPGSSSTSPLSTVFPSPEPSSDVPLSLKCLDGSGDTLSAKLMKVQLQAIPSPSLAPPSPFSLYPPIGNSPIDEHLRIGSLQAQSNFPPISSLSSMGTMTKRAFTKSTRSSLSLSSLPPSLPVNIPKPPLPSATSVPPLKTPEAELTIELMRELKAPQCILMPLCGHDEALDVGAILGPSISRRKGVLSSS